MFQEKVQKRLGLLAASEKPCQLVEISDNEVHLTEVGQGVADLQVLLMSPGILFRKVDEHKLPYLKIKTCADYVLFENRNNEWLVHIFELKKTVKTKEWIHIKKQFSGALQNAYALAGVLGVEINLDKVKAYTVYRNDKLNDASNPVKTRCDILEKHHDESALARREWNSDTAKIDFTEEVILEHHKVQLDIEKGEGLCQLV